MQQFSASCMIDVPMTSDPQRLRSFLAETRKMEPKDDVVLMAIAEAEQLLNDIESELKEQGRNP